MLRTASTGGVEYDQVEGVTALRRDHFVNALGSQPADSVIDPATIPAKKDEVDGIAWLPRLIVKARAKLAGELHLTCSAAVGIGRFFERNSSLVEFLQVTLDAGDDDRAIIDYLKDKRPGASADDDGMPRKAISDVIGCVASATNLKSISTCPRAG